MSKGKLRFSAVVIMIFAFALFGSGTGLAAENASEPAFVWDMLDINQATHPGHLFLSDFSDAVFEATKGQLKINVRLGGELPFGTAEYLRAVSDGSVQMATALITSISGDLQAGGIPALPFLATKGEELSTMMDILIPYINEELERYGIKYVMYIHYPNQDIWGRGPVPKSLQDLKNFKIRASGSEQAKYFQAVGMIPTSIDASEAVSSLSKGVINGVSTAAFTIWMNKWYEELEWGYLLEPQYVPSYVIINAEALASLPDDVRDGLYKVAAEMQPTVTQRMEDYNNNSFKHLAEDVGIVIVKASEEEKAAQIPVSVPIWETFVKNQGGKSGEALQKIREALGK